MPRILSLFIVSILPLLALAQEKVTVRVGDRDKGGGIENATVNVYTESPRQLVNTTQTNEVGDAIIEVSSYPAEIEVRTLGYDAEYISISQANGTREYSVSLSKRFNALNEVVVTGVPSPIRPKDALAVYKVITAANIKSRGAVSLDQAISNEMNTTVSYDPFLGVEFRMQGIGGDKTKFLVDGMPINGREAGNINISQISVNNTERIEIIQGPMSIMYGTDALAGVINVITKSNRKPWEVAASAQYESIGIYNFNVSGTKTWKRNSFTLGGGRNYSAGWGNADSMEPHRDRLFDPKEQYLGNFNYGYRAPSGFSVRLASDLVQEKITNKGEAHITPFEGYAFDDYYRTTRSTSRLLLEGKLGKSGHWQMMDGFSYYRHLKNSYRKNLVTLDESFLPGSIQDTSLFEEFSSRATYNTKKKRLDLAIGYDIDYQAASSKKIPGGSREMSDYALFATAALPFFKDKVTIQGGIRAEHNSLYSSPMSPALNLLVKPTDRIQVRASYAKGFRAPTLKELYLTFIDVNHHVLGNPELKAENSDHLQLSVSTQLLEKESNYAQLLITGYYNRTHDGIALTPDHPDTTSIDWTYRNINGMRNAIGTLEFEGQQENIHYKLGYSYTYTFEEKAQYSSFDAHEFTVNLQYYWKAPKMGVSLFTKFTGAQPSLVGNIDGSASYSGRQEAFTMMDFSLERKFLKNRVQLVAGVKNILDVRSLTATGIVATTVHNSNGTINYLPRRVFSSLNITLD